MGGSVIQGITLAMDNTAHYAIPSIQHDTWMWSANTRFIMGPEWVNGWALIILTAFPGFYPRLLSSIWDQRPLWLNVGYPVSSTPSVSSVPRGNFPTMQLWLCISPWVSCDRKTGYHCQESDRKPLWGKQEVDTPMSSHSVQRARWQRDGSPLGTKSHSL